MTAIKTWLIKPLLAIFVLVAAVTVSIILLKYLASLHYQSKVTTRPTSAPTIRSDIVIDEVVTSHKLPKESSSHNLPGDAKVVSDPMSVISVHIPKQFTEKYLTAFESECISGNEFLLKNDENECWMGQNGALGVEYSITPPGGPTYEEQYHMTVKNFVTRNVSAKVRECNCDFELTTATKAFLIHMLVTIYIDDDDFMHGLKHASVRWTIKPSRHI